MKLVDSILKVSNFLIEEMFYCDQCLYYFYLPALMVGQHEQITCQHKYNLVAET